MKIKGFQITTSGIKAEKVVEKRTVSYVDVIYEITVDTDKGSFIVTEQDLIKIKGV